MLCFVPLAGPLKGRRLEIQPGNSLGRDPACDVRLVHKSVSRRHARIEREGASWFLQDDGSRNGLFLNKQRTERIELRDGLLLKLGDYPIRVELSEARAQALSSAEVLDEELEFLEGTELEEAEFGDHGLELEDPAEIELGATKVRPGGEAGEAASPPRGPIAPVSERELQRAAVVRGLERDRTGLLRGELTQQPAWVQAAVWIGVLLVFGGVAAGIALLVSGVL